MATYQLDSVAYQKWRRGEVSIADYRVDGDPSTEMEDEEAAERGDISQPGDVQQDSADAFTAVVEDEARADIPEEP